MSATATAITATAIALSNNATATAKHMKGENMPATATATRPSYKLTDNNELARITLEGVNHYYAKTLQAFAHTFAGTKYAISSIHATMKANKTSKRVCVCIVPKLLASNGIYITTNSTCSIDYRKLADAYKKRYDKLAAKPAKPATAKPAKTDAQKAAARVNRYASATCKKHADNSIVRTMVTNYLSITCADMSVNRSEVLSLLRDNVRAIVS